MVARQNALVGCTVVNAGDFLAGEFVMSLSSRLKSLAYKMQQNTGSNGTVGSASLVEYVSSLVFCQRMLKRTIFFLGDQSTIGASVKLYHRSEFSELDLSKAFANFSACGPSECLLLVFMRLFHCI